jgi:hypothetical protein
LPASLLPIWRFFSNWGTPWWRLGIRTLAESGSDWPGAWKKKDLCRVSGEFHESKWGLNDITKKHRTIYILDRYRYRYRYRYSYSMWGSYQQKDWDIDSTKKIDRISRIKKNPWGSLKTLQNILLCTDRWQVLQDVTRQVLWPDVETELEDQLIRPWPAGVVPDINW